MDPVREHSSPDPLVLVSSLYGPGLFCGWVFTAASVLVSWTAGNTKTPSEDTISNDLIAVACLPLVAGGHIIAQLLRFPGDRAQIVSSRSVSNHRDPDIEPYIAAMDAPLVICEDYMMFSLVLLWVAVATRGLKCSMFAAATGAWSFLAVAIIAFQGPPVDVWSLRQDQTSLFWSPRHAVPATVILSVDALVCMTLFAEANVWSLRRAHRGQARYGDGEEPRIYATVFIGLLVLANLAVIDSFLSPLGILYIKLFSYPKVAVTAFIPKTSSALSDLEQAFALASGIVTFVCTLYRAFLKPQHRKEDQKQLDTQIIHEPIHSWAEIFEL